MNAYSIKTDTDCQCFLNGLIKFSISESEESLLCHMLVPECAAFMKVSVTTRRLGIYFQELILTPKASELQRKEQNSFMNAFTAVNAIRLTIPVIKSQAV